MAKEVLELEVKTNVSGAKQEMDQLGSSVSNAETELKELNEQLQIQVEVVNKLETALLEMKQQQSVNSDYENSVSRLNERIKETTMELALEKQGLKTLKAERSVAIKSVKDLEKAQKDQIKQAFAGIKHFNIMGVSLRRLRLMVRAVIPSFKLMFKTIKMGIASTGIGIIVVALGAVFTAMMRTGKGAKAFKMVLAGIGEVVNALLKPLEIAGDAILSLFGVDDAPAVDVVAQMKSEIEDLNRALGDIELQQIKNREGNRENKKIVDDVTQSEENRLAALKEIFDTETKTNKDKIHNLKIQIWQQGEIARKAKSSYDFHVDENASQETLNALKQAQITEEETLLNMRKKLAELTDAQFIREDNYENDISEIKSFNINNETNKEKELANKRKQWREDRKRGEEELAAIILKLQEEATLEALETDEEVEKKKLEFKMEKMKEDIKNSKASEETKNEALKLLEEDYQNDLQEITDKFKDKNKEKLEKEAQDLEKIRNANILKEIEDEDERQLKLLEIQKQAELDKIAEHENFAELKIEIDKKYARDVAEVEEKIKDDQIARDKEVHDAKKGLAMTGMDLIKDIANFEADQAVAKDEEIERSATRGAKIAKGIAISQATISGVEAVQNAFTTAQKSPITTVFPAYPFLQAGAAATFSALQLRKIIAGEPASDDGGGGGGGGGMQEVADTTPATQMLSGSFTLGQGVAPEPVKAFVVTDEMTNSQNQLANIRRRSTI